jgi:hypothetical protein
MLPYNAGRFLSGSHERGIKDYLKQMERRGITPDQTGSLMYHFTMTNAAWQEKAQGATQARLYMTSCMLVYYFCHLDGDGSGARFFKYMDKMREARDAWDTFFKDPRVQHFPGGRFSFPSTLTMPAQKRDESYGLEQLSILLDGRDADQLQRDVVNGFKKIGVRW